ncbi:MAG: hypothetical protein RIS35_1685 [Pseudomonadota bacterium]|jgi:nucleoside-diphosphate-sugar epimerase
MRVLVTGASGFVARHLIRALAGQEIMGPSGVRGPVDELVLADVVEPRAPSDGPWRRIRVETGDFADPAFVARLTADGHDSIFHLAAALTIDAEADFRRGLEVNVLGFVHLLEACRAMVRPPRLVFASSIAAFGGPLPAVVDDHLAQTPQTSYGTHKSIAELLLNDYSRRGFVDARALRLPVVLTRPGSPTPAVSDRIASILREPLMGRDVVCPLSISTRIPVSSVQRVAAALLALHDLPAAALGHTRALNLPSLTVSIGEMIDAVRRAGPGRPIGRIEVAPDPGLQAVVDGWPSAFVSERASAVGIRADASIDEVVGALLADLASTDG